MAEMFPSDTTPIMEISAVPDIEKAREFCAHGNYIFRGENEKYEGGVRSGLYRQYSGDANADKPSLTNNMHFSILDVEKDIIKDARKHVCKDASDTKVLTELQHYGGKTALIDFSKSLYIALFFACNGKFDKHGRLILVNTDGLEQAKIDYSNDKAMEKMKDKNILVAPEPEEENHRANFQESVFFHARQGLLFPYEYRFITVNNDIKEDVLKYLHNNHDISLGTVYNDFHGFIKNQAHYTTTYLEFHWGLEYQKTGDNDSAAVTHYNKAINLHPELAVAYFNLGLLHEKLGNTGAAKKDFTEAKRLYTEQGNAECVEIAARALNRLQNPKED